MQFVVSLRIEERLCLMQDESELQIICSLGEVEVVADKT